MKELCSYKNILGIPGKGIHFHVFGIAIMDLIFTIIGSILFSYYTQYGFMKSFIFLMIVGLLLHHLFCVDTTLTRIFF